MAKQKSISSRSVWNGCAFLCVNLFVWQLIFSLLMGVIWSMLVSLTVSHVGEFTVQMTQQLVRESSRAVGFLWCAWSEQVGSRHQGRATLPPSVLLTSVFTWCNPHASHSRWEVATDIWYKTTRTCSKVQLWHYLLTNLNITVWKSKIHHVLPLFSWSNVISGKLDCF